MATADLGQPGAPLPAPSTTVPSTVVTELEYGELPPTGVRKVMDAFHERDQQWIRWGGVIGGFFIAWGTAIILGLLGLAISLPVARGPLLGLTIFTGVWFAATELVANFIGGFAAAKLAGAIRRTDGLIDGLIVWALGMVVVAFAAGGPIITAAMQAPPDYAAANGMAWYSFGLAALSLLASLVGGIAGAAGRRLRSRTAGVVESHRVITPREAVHG
jgi:hypothetical protein